MQRFYNACRIRAHAVDIFALFVGSFLGFFLLQTRKAHLFLLLLFLIPIVYFKWLKKDKRLARSYLLGFAIGLLFSSLSRFLPLLDGETKMTGVVLEAKDNYFVFWAKGRRFYVSCQSNLYEEGDLLELSGHFETLSFSHQEGRFDFKEYLLGKGVKQEFALKSVDALFLRPIRLRAMERNFLSFFSKETSACLDAMLFSKRDYSSDIVSLAKDLNIISLLGSSGIYFGLFKRFLYRFFNYFVEERKQTILVFLVLSLIFPFVFFKIGIDRIYLSLGLDVLCVVRKKEKLTFLKKLGIIGVLFFFLNPFIYMDQGFLISFGFSFYIYLKKVEIHAFEKKRTRKMMSFLSSLFFLFPLFLNGGSFSLLSPFASLLFPPILLPYIVSGYFSFLFRTPFYFLERYTSFLLSFFSSLSALSPHIAFFRIDSFFIDAYYGVLFLSLYLKEEGFNFTKERILLFSFFSYFLSILPITNYFTYEVSFLDVGQGDSILIRIHDKAILIDTGGDNRFDMAKEVLIPYLRKENIRKLDALIITHPDFDHNGAKESLLTNYRVLALLEDKEDFPYRFGPITLENLNEREGTSSDKNIGSLVLDFTLKNLRFLLMGDAPKEVEEEIIKKKDVKCDILKVGHHGSKTSSSMSFLKAASPEEAIISCGTKNKFGHPDGEVLKRLETEGISIRRTDLEGTITYKGILQEGFSFF
ncbi:MAG TPA: hypothetical protein DCZ41_01840 [Firmicutes bacterium]|nr:hypothetical protein [Bacillota bacterium]